MLGETKALLPEENYRKIRFKKGGYWAQLLGIDAKSEDRTERQYWSMMVKIEECALLKLGRRTSPLSVPCPALVGLPLKTRKRGLPYIR